MTIRYNCEKCGQLLKIKDELAGAPNKCPTCKTRFIVPAVSDSAVAGDSKPNLVPRENDSGILVEDAVRAGARADSKELSGILRTEASARSEKSAPAAAAVAPPTPAATPAAAAKKADEDFDPADFLMEGKPKKVFNRPVETPPPAAAPAAPVVEAPPPPPAEPVEEFDAAAFLIEETKKAAAPPPPPAPAPGTPPTPRRWGMRQPAAPQAPPGSAAASAAASALGTIAPPPADVTDLPDAQPKMVQLPQETPREPINIGRAIRGVGAGRWTTLVLSLLVGGGLYWWMIQPKLEVPPLGQVSGVVTLDGKPVPGAIVTFAPEKREYKVSKNVKGMGLRTATGITDGEGRYTLYYVENIRGTFLGTNRISVQPILNGKGQDTVPSDWGRKSTHTVDVMEGGNPQFDIVMKGTGR